ncbi:MAG: ATP-binding protein [Bacteroidota bacterium]|nr:ATP-binding protein [Bacteroidota bacterium]MDP4191324.1 ATP-binding protein [Bacteroidota bacterium]MDP4195803.1 ATP-binding protein [Bacteroidota bacterium]
MHNKVQDNKLQILGKLAASLAHEIRNPLSAIKLNLEFVKMSEINDEVRESINSCIEAAKRIQNLIETTLDFSRSSINDCVPQSLNDVTVLAIEIMSTRAKVLNISVIDSLDYTIPSVYFNKNQMLQVVLNLMTNAFEAIEKNGTVYIKTYSEKLDGNQLITLEVEDTGKGISEENKEKIFNDFYTNKKHGTGLGLSVCKMILDGFNASMTFESQLNKGTRFFVRFNPNNNGVTE